MLKYSNRSLCHHIDDPPSLVTGCGSEEVIIIREGDVDNGIRVGLELKMNITKRVRRAARGVEQTYAAFLVTDRREAVVMTSSRAEWNAPAGAFVAYTAMDVFRSAAKVGGVNPRIGGWV